MNSSHDSFAKVFFTVRFEPSPDLQRSGYCASFSSTGLRVNKMNFRCEEIPRVAMIEPMSTCDEFVSLALEVYEQINRYLPAVGIVACDCPASTSPATGREVTCRE